MILQFTAYVTPQPQGSIRAFVRGNRAHLTSDNAKLKPFRSEVTRCAMWEMAEKNLESPMAAKGVAVSLHITCTFRKPASVAKKRTEHIVKPDIDKLCRAVMDALTGVAYADDSQVVLLTCEKVYGEVESVRVLAALKGIA